MNITPDHAWMVAMVINAASNWMMARSTNNTGFHLTQVGVFVLLFLHFLWS